MNHDDREVFPSPDYKEEQLIEDADGRQLTVTAPGEDDERHQEVRRIPVGGPAEGG